MQYGMTVAWSFTNSLMLKILNLTIPSHHHIPQLRWLLAIHAHPNISDFVWASITPGCCTAHPVDVYVPFYFGVAVQ